MPMLFQDAWDLDDTEEVMDLVRCGTSSGCFSAMDLVTSTTTLSEEVISNKVLKLFYYCKLFT